MLWSALGFLFVGVISLFFPIVSSLAVELMVGWIFIFAGVVVCINAFSLEGTGPFFGNLLLGLLQFAGGLFLIFHPALGMLLLSIFVVAAIIIDGAQQIVIGFELKPLKGWGWAIVSGLISVVCGILIAMGLPGASAVLLGILLGVNFISTGISLLALRSSVSKS